VNHAVSWVLPTSISFHLQRRMTYQSYAAPRTLKSFVLAVYVLSLEDLPPAQINDIPTCLTLHSPRSTNNHSNKLTLTAMAQTKKKAITIPNKEAVKKNEDRVVKRPARGFHRFRNGILNVAPKGGEKELSVV
jgi:hypothetical protein